MTLLSDVEAIGWDIEPLVEGEGAAGFERLLTEADELADQVAERRGKVAALDRGGLLEVLLLLERIADRVGRAGAYAALGFSTDTADPARGALMTKLDGRSAQIDNKLVFFDLEWADLPDARVEELLAGEEMAFCAHHLRSLRRYRPHQLSEPEEKLLSEKAVTGISAWSRLFNELTSAVKVDLDGRELALMQALSELESPDPSHRRAVAAAVTTALAPGLRTRAYVYNTVLADKATDDRLRSYPTWLSSMNLANQAGDESVQALVAAVKRRYDIPQRWYSLKAQLMGVERLADYDRMASVADSDTAITWAEARDLVLDTFADFSPVMADEARPFFDNPWIDAPVRPAKTGGAFCHYTVPSAHPYVMLNWTGRRLDALTLAHELGHGLHSSLARPQRAFHFSTGLTLAETASVFAETLTFERLLDLTTDPIERLSLCASSIEGAIATVFRQTAMNQFEEAAHTIRRTEGELSVEQFNELWASTQHEMLGDAVEITDGYRSWWSYVSHFVAVPGYVYAYAYGQLLALSVYKRYTEQGEAFVPRYLDLLRAGGSMAPEELGRLVDCDLADPGFWDGGLAIVERQLARAEEAARAAGRLG